METRRETLRRNYEGRWKREQKSKERKSPASTRNKTRGNQFRNPRNSSDNHNSPQTHSFHLRRAMLGQCREEYHCSMGSALLLHLLLLPLGNGKRDQEERVRRKKAYVVIKTFASPARLLTSFSKLCSENELIRGSIKKGDKEKESWDGSQPQQEQSTLFFAPQR